MNSVKDILQNIPALTASEPKDSKAKQPDVMTNPEYLRHSSQIISEALQKGFDVLQLENGDIVTTGTKIIITQFRWDEEKQKMSKLAAKEAKVGKPGGKKTKK